MKKKEIHHEDKFKINQILKKIQSSIFFLKKYSNDKILDLLGFYRLTR